jgi:predicted small secreted protein
MKRTIFLICSILILSALLAGCSSTKTLAGADRDAVLAYSEPQADALLAAYNQNDYAAFSKNFDAAMLKGIDAKAFANLETTLMPKIGQYVSRSVSSVVDDGKFIQVLYSAKFEAEDPVTVRLVFNKDDAHTITGLWFDSPKLRQK